MLLLRSLEGDVLLEDRPSRHPRGLGIRDARSHSLFAIGRGCVVIRGGLVESCDLGGDLGAHHWTGTHWPLRSSITCPVCGFVARLGTGAEG